MTDINQVEATEAATSNVETQGSNETNNAFTQEQLDRIVEDRLAKQRRALEKRYNGVDPDHYKELASAEEEKRLEDAKAKGEFEKILKETVTSKDNAINQLRTELTSVKVDGAVLSAASKAGAINAQQVVSLVKNQIRLGDDGNVEILSKEGQPRYNDKGEPMSVDSLVSEFIQANPHFKSATPGGTSSKSNLSPNKSTGGKLDLASLDMTNPNHRKMFKEAKQKGLL
tara:strand:+ start:4621 stop:5304 length:684 start_codon:yes stop_codon:yes gene_type:complete